MHCTLYHPCNCINVKNALTHRLSSFGNKPQSIRLSTISAEFRTGISKQLGSGCRPCPFRYRTPPVQRCNVQNVVRLLATWTAWQWRYGGCGGGREVFDNNDHDTNMTPGDPSAFSRAENQDSYPQVSCPCCWLFPAASPPWSLRSG